VYRSRETPAGKQPPHVARVVLGSGQKKIEVQAKRWAPPDITQFNILHFLVSTVHILVNRDPGRPGEKRFFSWVGLDQR
jgi:hypothetical protein